MQRVWRVENAKMPHARSLWCRSPMKKGATPFQTDVVFGSMGTEREEWIPPSRRPVLGGYERWKRFMGNGCIRGGQDFHECAATALEFGAALAGRRLEFTNGMVLLLRNRSNL